MSYTNSVTRLPRPHNRPEGRTIPWRVSATTKARFYDLALQWEGPLQGSAASAALEEEIQLLPGFPRDYDPRYDIVELVVTTVTSH